MNKMFKTIIIFATFLIFVSFISCEKNESEMNLKAELNSEIVKEDPESLERSDCDPCDCDAYLQLFLVYRSYCNIYPGSHYCDLAAQMSALYTDCVLNWVPECPNGFTFDGCNCYSGVHFPDGYQGFVYGNGFYVVPNCNLGISNNCCPPGFTFDGANCHYYGLYFPIETYSGFVYGNAFYTTPGPCQ